MIRFATLGRCASRLTPTLTLLALPALPAQQNFNVTFNPRATYVWGQYGGDALFALYPGKEWPNHVVKTWSMSMMPPGAIEVSLQPLAFAIWEPDACAVGAELRFDGNYWYNTSGPISTVPHTGWSFHPGYSRLDPFYWFQSPGNSSDQDWWVSYVRGGGVPASTSSCLPVSRFNLWAQDLFPDYVVMALAVRFQ